MQTDLGDLPVFPCSLDKRPLIASGFKAGKLIEPPGFWPLVGVPTGSASGFDVLDIDPDGLAWLADNPLRTRRHRTPRGWHLLFHHVEGLRCSAGRIARGVDVRGDGGFVVWWPRQSLEVVDVELGDWPEGMLALVRKSWDGSGSTRTQVNSAHARGNGGEPEPTVSVKLRSKYLLLKVEKAPVGTRNNCLFWASCVFGEMIGEGRIKREIAEHLLREASKVNGLWSDDPAEVGDTIKSGVDRGIKGYIQWAANQGAGKAYLGPSSAASGAATKSNNNRRL